MKKLLLAGTAVLLMCQPSWSKTLTGKAFLSELSERWALYPVPADQFLKWTAAGDQDSLSATGPENSFVTAQCLKPAVLIGVSVPRAYPFEYDHDKLQVSVGVNSGPIMDENWGGPLMAAYNKAAGKIWGGFIKRHGLDQAMALPLMQGWVPSYYSTLRVSPSEYDGAVIIDVKNFRDNMPFLEKIHPALLVMNNRVESFTLAALASTSLGKNVIVTNVSLDDPLLKNFISDCVH